MQWRQIHDGIYSVSEFGDVRRNSDNLILKSHINKKGYLRVNLTKNGKQRLHLIASIVASAFIGKKPHGLTINHKDLNKINNHPSNLEYISNLENMRHAWNNGLHNMKKGSTNHTAKLTNSDVIFIRNSYPFNKDELSKTFKVDESTIRSIKNRRTWKHI